MAGFSAIIQRNKSIGEDSMETNTALGLVGYGLLLGATIAFMLAFLIFRKREKQLKQTLEEEKSVIITILESANKQLGQEIDHANDLEDKVEQQAKKLGELEVSKARIEAGIEAERKASEKLVTNLLETQKTLKSALNALSNKALRESIPTFVEGIDPDSGHKSIGALVEPVKKQLEELREFVHEVEKNRENAFLTSQEQVRQIFETVEQTARSIEELRDSPEQLERDLERLAEDFEAEFGNLRIVESTESKKAG